MVVVFNEVGLVVGDIDGAIVLYAVGSADGSKVEGGPVGS